MTEKVTYKPLDIRGYMEYILQVPRGYPSDKAITVGDGLTVMVQATRNVPSGEGPMNLLPSRSKPLFPSSLRLCFCFHLPQSMWVGLKIEQQIRGFVIIVPIKRARNGWFFPKFQVQRIQTHLQLPGKTCSAPAAFRAAKAYATLGKVWEAAARAARCEACRPGS